MKSYNGIKLVFKNKKARKRYLSLFDLVQDLKISCLITLVPALLRFSEQMTVMREIEKRNEMNECKYFELLETCNGY